MKIVGVSNHMRDDVFDILVAESIPDPLTADIMCKALNGEISNDGATYFFMVKPDDYELYTVNS